MFAMINEKFTFLGVRAFIDLEAILGQNSLSEY
jgi:hypothetical protein